MCNKYYLCSQVKAIIKRNIKKIKLGKIETIYIIGCILIIIKLIREHSFETISSGIYIKN